MQDETLIVDVAGFEGPLDLLLTLARGQKVDLMALSVLALADQYLGFIENARSLRIELAADYLVMAAWLAYLKSRLLLPPDPEAQGPSAEDMAADLATRLERLDLIRQGGRWLIEGTARLGQARFARGAPDEVLVRRDDRFVASLGDLMRAYARLRTRDDFRPYAFDRRDVLSMEQALDRLRDLVGQAPDWATLARYLPKDWDTPARRRSATAAHFAAALELARQGRVDLRQAGMFQPLELRGRT